MDGPAGACSRTAGPLTAPCAIADKESSGVIICMLTILLSSREWVVVTLLQASQERDG